MLYICYTYFTDGDGCDGFVVNLLNIVIHVFTYVFRVLSTFNSESRRLK